MAPDKKGAARLNAALIFLDESGFMMAPLLRRTWARRGVTPVFHQRGRSHRKASAIVAPCVPPGRHRVHCYFRLYPDADIDTAAILSFLRQLVAHVAGVPFVLIWDRLQAHRSRAVRAFLSDHAPAKAEFLPAYAPELNPVEYAWSYLKVNPLANAGILELDGLSMRPKRPTRAAHSPLGKRRSSRRA